MTAMFSKARTLSSFGRLTKAYKKWLSVLQPVLGPNYILHKDAREGVAYIMPQGSEIEVYRKVSGFVALIDDTSSMLYVNMAKSGVLINGPNHCRVRHTCRGEK